MFWDIAIGVVAFAANFVTAYAGWKVTVNPVLPTDRHRRTKLEAIIWTSFVIGALAVIVTGIRGIDIRAELQSVRGQLSDIQQKQRTTNMGIQKINKAHPELVQLETFYNVITNQPIYIGFKIQNVSQSTANNVHAVFLIYPHHGKRSAVVENGLWTKFEKEFNKVNSTRPADSAPPLGPQEVREAFAPFRPTIAEVAAWGEHTPEPNVQMYGIGKAIFEDDAGQHEKDFCIRLPLAVLKPGSIQIYSFCDDHNGEK